MAEKKLTDEDIKSIRHDLVLQKGVAGLDGFANIPQSKLAKWLDLIDYLQSEIKYKTECYDELCNMNNEIEAEVSEQKAEIERLKIRRGKALLRVDELKNALSDTIKRNEELVEENERLTEELAEEKKQYFKMQDIAGNRYFENVELQKQVNELKQENSVLSVTVELQEEVEKQIVKDMAKEIEDKIQELLDMHFEGKTEKQEYQRKGMEEGLKMALEIVRECKGVEVE